MLSSLLWATGCFAANALSALAQLNTMTDGPSGKPWNLQPMSNGSFDGHHWNHGHGHGHAHPTHVLSQLGSSASVTESPTVLSSSASDNSNSSSNAGPPTAGIDSNSSSNVGPPTAGVISSSSFSTTSSSAQGQPTAGAGSSDASVTTPAGSWSYSYSYGNTDTASSDGSSQQPSGSGSSTTGSSSDTPTSSSSPPSSSSSTDSSTQQSYLDDTNKVRSQYGANSVEWSDTLVSFAQNWANNCQFKHSGGDGKYGENIYAGTGSQGPSDAINNWAGEASQYDPSNPTDSHFTQLVWKATTQIGCAYANCSNMFPGFSDATYIVCEYYPPGNVKGQYQQNVQA